MRTHTCYLVEWHVVRFGTKRTSAVLQVVTATLTVKPTRWWGKHVSHSGARFLHNETPRSKLAVCDVDHLRFTLRSIRF